MCLEFNMNYSWDVEGIVGVFSLWLVAVSCRPLIMFLPMRLAVVK